VIVINVRGTTVVRVADNETVPAPKFSQNLSAPHTNFLSRRKNFGWPLGLFWLVVSFVPAPLARAQWLRRIANPISIGSDFMSPKLGFERKKYYFTFQVLARRPFGK
jgi:hypothetical protein